MKPRAKQTEFKFPLGWGGKRRGAGRKAKGKPCVSRHGRAVLGKGHPVHVTVKLRAGLPSLRKKATYKMLREKFVEGCERFGFRLVHYCVMGNHMHLLCEARDRRALSCGMQGLLIRVARGLNKLWGRAGKVFADRYHDHILTSPREVRHALVYVLHNAKRHGLRFKQGLDFYCSGVWFDGWFEKLTVRGLEGVERPVARARTWLLKEGWRKHGRVKISAIPAAT